MRYGRVDFGPWHILVGQGKKTLCPAIRELTFTEVADSRPQGNIDVCGNCDERLRRKGKEASYSSAERKSDKSSYVPRFKFKDAQ